MKHCVPIESEWINKTENAFSPTLPEMLFDREKNHKMLQNTNAEQN